MPKEILIEILTKKLYLELGLIIVLYFLNLSILLSLGLKLNNVFVRLKGRLVFGLTCWVTYCLIGKQFLPASLFGLGVVFIMAALFRLIGKIPLLKAFYTSFIVMLLLIFGSTIILQPFILLNLKFYSPGTITGVVISTIAEAVLPAIILFLIPLLNVPFNSAKGRSTRIDFLGLVIFAVLFYILYYLSFLFLWFYRNNSPTTALIVLQVILFSLAGLVFFYISKTKQKKYLEQNQVQTYLEQSHRLIDVLFSERRDYRNKLQVMNMMAAGNKTEQLNEYIFKSIDELAAAGMNNIQNPILAAAIVSRQVAAKEQDVAIMVQCDNPFQDPPVNPVKLGELFELLLDILIESELVSRCSPRVVFINIIANNQEYIFDFHNSEAATANLAKAPEGENAEYLSIDKAKQKNQLELVEKLLNEINGEYSVSFQGDALVGLKITFRKNGKKFSLPA